MKKTLYVVIRLKTTGIARNCRQQIYKAIYRGRMQRINYFICSITQYNLQELYHITLEKQRQIMPKIHGNSMEKKMNTPQIYILICPKKELNIFDLTQNREHKIQNQMN